MVCAFGDLKILKGSDNRYRCPLCTDLLFPPTDSLTKVEKHFTAQHWFKKIPFKGNFLANEELAKKICMTVFHLVSRRPLTIDSCFFQIFISYDVCSIATSCQQRVKNHIGTALFVQDITFLDAE